ncbi:MAG: hypothetical protein JWQ64_692 [Subtercola sp.]|nr:hypothetical protein [Subtercola sp.]
MRAAVVVLQALEGAQHKLPTTPDARALRRLYFTRAVFSALWVGSVFAFAGTSTNQPSPPVVVLLVIYPLWDAVATMFDLSADRTGRSRLPQLLNLAFDIAAAIGIGLALITGTDAAVGVFGVWAVLAGALQLLLGLRRRRQGGQWAMIASGAISVIAGISFVFSSISGNSSLTSLAGYSLFGAVWFLIAALFLTRAITSERRPRTAA